MHITSRTLVTLTISLGLFLVGGSVAFAAAPTVSLTPPTSTIVVGDEVTLHWSATGATSCTSPDFETGGATSGDVVVTPTATKTYTVTCDGVVETTWQLEWDDYTDYFCLNPNGLDDPNQNGLNRAYAGIPNCNFSNSNSNSCSTAGARCKVNTGQCVIHTEIYTCTAGGDTGGGSSSATATATATVTVNPLPPPTCSLTAPITAFTGWGVAQLSWTTTGAVGSITFNHGLNSFPLSLGHISPIINDTISYTATVTGPTGLTGQCGIDFTVTPFPQCKDGKDNSDPEDTLKDAQDPGCHTDGNPNNPDSYNPNDNDETDNAVIGCQLEIQKNIISKTEFVPGEKVTYRINFKNIGDRDCTGGGVKIVDTLDPGLTFYPLLAVNSSNVTKGYGSYDLYTHSDRTLRWNANTLNPNEDGFVEYRATVGTPSSCEATIPNTAKISAYELDNFGDWEESTANIKVTKDCTPPPPQCPLIAEAPNGVYAISGATTVELDATDLGSEAGYVNSFGYYLADASRNPIKGAIVWANVKNPSTPHVTLTLSSADVAGASYIAFFIIPNGGSLGTFSNGQAVTFANSGGWKILVGSVYVPTRFGDPLLNGGVDYERDQSGVPGNSDWEDLTDNDYNDVQVQVSIRACNVPPPPTDVCPNIPGNQATVPEGKQLVNGQCVPIEEPEDCKLEITKSADKTSLDPNEKVEYTITFKNVGEKNCTGGGVKVVDVLAPGLTYVSESHSGDVDQGYGSDPVYKSSDRTLRWNANVLTPGESGWVRFKAKAQTPDSCSVIIPNKAKISADQYNNFHDWVESNTVNVSVTKDCGHTEEPSCVLAASPDSFTAPGSTTLSWITHNVTSLSIDKGIGAVTPVAAGSTSTPVTSSTTYTATATGPGGQVTCTAAVTVTPTQTPTPACTLSASKTSIQPGESVNISWTSANVTSGTVTPQVGNTSPVASGHTDGVFPSDDTTYTGTFTGPNGSVTCTVFVDVQTGGGGCVGNTCPGGMDQPNVTLLRAPGEEPLAALVYLSQVPYTGFEAGPALTVIFWLAIALLSALAAYFVMGHNALRYLSLSFSDLGGRGLAYQTTEVEEEHGREREAVYGVEYPEATPAYAKSTMAMPAPALAIEPYVVELPRASAPAPTPVVAAEPGTGIPSLVDVIESRAHASGVLISPEAVTAATRLSADRAETLVIFGNILNRAIQTIPRDDGWVMLTGERFAELRKAVTGNAEPAAFKVEPIGASAAPASASESAASAFVNAILSGNRDTAFGIVRSMEKDGIAPTALMTGTALELDRRYRTNPSDARLHTLVEIFTHAIDQSYANPFTGVKLALAQAFEAI